MGKTVFITGATSGIGLSCANLFAKNNYNLIICGRRKDRLNKLKKELNKQFEVNIKILSFDVRDKKSVFNAITKLVDENFKIDIQLIMLV